MWIAKSSDSDSRRPSAAIASRRANLRIRYVSSRAETRIRDTGYASNWASWSAGAIATRSDAAPRSSASRTRAFPRFRARAYAGSRRISSRLTFSARMKADASRRNGYFARVASSTQLEDPLLLPSAAGRHPRRRGVVDVVLGRHLVNHADVASVHDFFVKHSRGRFVLLFSHVVFLLKSP